MLLFLCANLSIGQEISGYIFDSKTKEPISGVSVFFDGSSMGTITNSEGKFKIRTAMKTHAMLVVSHIGYTTKKIDNPFQGDELRIAFVEYVQEIPEVILTSDPFTRKQKLRVFRKEFLGDTKTAKYCRILNEDSIELFFNTYDNTLSAYANNPIIVENKYLEYLVNFNLEEFKISFRKKSLDRLDNIKYTLFEGSTHFTNIDTLNSKIFNRREKAYLGSPMHFMRTCRNNSWKDQNFTLKQELRTVSPNQLIENIGTENDAFKTIKFLNKNFLIYHKKKWNYRSTVKLTEDNYSFSIDKYGNYKPYINLIFGGYMGSLRIGDMLPIDYKLH